MTAILSLLLIFACLLLAYLALALQERKAEARFLYQRLQEQNERFKNYSILCQEYKSISEEFLQILQNNHLT